MSFEALYKEIVDVSGESYDYHSIIKPRMIYLWDKISHLISSDSVVAEIGIGPMAAMIKQLKRAEVIGIDHVNNQMAMCNNFNIEFKMCDLQTDPLPLQDESIDIIFLLEVIEHLCIWPNYVLDNIYKKLKPGGYVIVSTVNLLRISNRIRMFMGKSPLTNYFEPTDDGRNHVREFTLAEMSYYMEKSDFNIEGAYRFGIPSGNAITSTLLRLAYFYPRFRNYFTIIGKK